MADGSTDNLSKHSLSSYCSIDRANHRWHLTPQSPVMTLLAFSACSLISLGRSEELICNSISNSAPHFFPSAAESGGTGKEPIWPLYSQLHLDSHSTMYTSQQGIHHFAVPAQATTQDLT